MGQARARTGPRLTEVRFSERDVDLTNVIIGLGIFLAMSALTASVLRSWLRRDAQAAAAVEEERAREWYATVVSSEVKEIVVGGGAQGMHRKIPMIVVYYQRDDGLQGNVMRYQGEAMNSMYFGALAYYRHAPAYAELESWQPGDRLYKPAGSYFPHRV